jgi:magnesium chelatase accessory protein
MAATHQRLQWERDSFDWPHREASRFVQAAGLRWHIQTFDPPPDSSGHLPGSSTPVALLIHGTGAATHSWRSVAPLLAERFRVLSLDLPGHGFTDMPAGGATSAQLSLPGMAQAIGALLTVLELTPALVVGHSAGAAIGVRMCLDGLIAPKAIVSLNGAFLPLGGLAGQFFSPVARLMSAVPFVPQLFSWRAADPAILQRLMDSTGSKLDAAGMALYGKLVSNAGHAAGALAMMANWDLPQLTHDLYRLKVPLCLVVGVNDKTIPPRQAHRVSAILSSSASATQPTLTTLQGLGHLAHEERPDVVAAVVLAQFDAAKAAP